MLRRTVLLRTMFSGVCLVAGLCLGLALAADDERLVKATEEVRKELDADLRSAGREARSGRIQKSLNLYIASARKAEAAIEEIQRSDERGRTVKEIEAFRVVLAGELRRAANLARFGDIQTALDIVAKAALTAQSLGDRMPPANTGPTNGAPVEAGPPPASESGARPEPGAPLKTNGPVERALDWLAAHQSPHGGWEAAGFSQWCNGSRVVDPTKQPDGYGKAIHDVGVSGLAVSAFLSAGYSNRGRHRFAKTIRNGLLYLIRMQDAEGCVGPRTPKQYIYGHAAASLALLKAYERTRSRYLLKAAQGALDFIALARNPYFAWRYGIKPGDNDTSVSGWMILVLGTAQRINRDVERRGGQAPLLLDETAFEGMGAWLTKVTDVDSGRVGYNRRGTGASRPEELLRQFPAHWSESPTAIAVLSRMVLGANPFRDRLVRLGAGRCASRRPVWSSRRGSIDLCYWYYGTLALAPMGGDFWSHWRRSLTFHVLPYQRKDTETCLYKGSWDPLGAWGQEGGRVYATALLSMVLSTYYEHP